MVGKMMRWRPWPPIASRKYEVRLVVSRLGGVAPAEEAEPARLMAEVRWKGARAALGTFRRTVRRNFTKEECLRASGVVEWMEEFHNVCSFSFYRESSFLPWEVAFTVFKGLSQNLKGRIPIIGTASLNLAEYVSVTEGKELEIVLPLSLASGASESPPTLHLTISCLELQTPQEPSETVQRSIVPVPLSPSPVDPPAATEKDELSALKAGLRRVKIFTEYVSTRRPKKACAAEEEGSDERCSGRSEDGECTYPFDTDSLDEVDNGVLDNGKEECSFRKSFSYGTLASTNYIGGSYYCEMQMNGDNEDWFYYSNRKSDVGCVDREETGFSALDQSRVQTSKRSILSWKKRKISFRSPKAKGEPLLKKTYGEDGGDDIDFDRRQLSSSDESLGLGGPKSDGQTIANRPSISEFGDDNFAVGSWEQKEVTSRDGHMKLSTQVFFASIDQRSERAAGESACTALVAVIADWFQTNREILPIKSQFDSLIREGSLEWRSLCDNEAYLERFPDKHFDLETVLQAKIRPLSVVPEKSFIGFFQPDSVEEIGFDFLHCAMSFDNIWDEITQAGSCLSDSDPQIYIVSWNDHFFVLKVEPEAYYIIDTLGERLYEGCDQAYILKFDKETTIYRLPENAETKEGGKPGKFASENENQQGPQDASTEISEPNSVTDNKGEELEVILQGKEACKEYIKNFLAAIPIRELLNDVKKGLRASTPLHHRLQIEFHLTEFSQPMVTSPAATGAALIATPSISLD